MASNKNGPISFFFLFFLNSSIIVSESSMYINKIQKMSVFERKKLMFCVADPYGRSPPFAPLGTLGAGAFGGLGSPSLG